MTQTPPGGPPPIQPAPSIQPPRGGAGLAVAALVLGLCGLFPLLGIVCAVLGIAFGIVSLARKCQGKGLAVAGIIAGVATLLTVQALSVVAVGRLATRAREQAKQTVCMTNLSAVAKGIQLYAADHDAFPPDLKRVAAEYLGDDELLKCPSARSGRMCDYFYHPPAGKPTAVQRPGSTILACDLKGNHPGRRCVAFVVGHCRAMPERDFQKSLSQPANAAFAEALRQAEGP